MSLSLQLSEDETDGRDGRASAVETVAGETTPTGDKTMKEDNSTSARVNVCVQLRVCVDFCPCGSWKDKERCTMISTWWACREKRSHIGFSISILACRERVWPFIYCPLNRPFWHLFVVMASSIWTLGKHVFPLQTKANWLLYMGPINLSLDWQWCVYDWCRLAGPFRLWCIHAN